MFRGSICLLREVLCPLIGVFRVWYPWCNIFQELPPHYVACSQCFAWVGASWSNSPACFPMSAYIFLYDPEVYWWSHIVFPYFQNRLVLTENAVQNFHSESKVLMLLHIPSGFNSVYFLVFIQVSSFFHSAQFLFPGFLVVSIPGLTSVLCFSVLHKFLFSPALWSHLPMSDTMRITRVGISWICLPTPCVCMVKLLLHPSGRCHFVSAGSEPISMVIWC